MALADLKFKVFPNERLEWDFDLSIWAELYSNLDNEAKALQVCRTIVENSENKLLDEEFGNNAVNFNRLKEVATKYKDNDLLKRLEKL
jgi:iron uptake system EfeUOB component EfeO/EfeM